jgi:hypothetical protein
MAHSCARAFETSCILACCLACFSPLARAPLFVCGVVCPRGAGGGLRSEVWCMGLLQRGALGETDVWIRRRQEERESFERRRRLPATGDRRPRQTLCPPPLDLPPPPSSLARPLCVQRQSNSCAPNRACTSPPAHWQAPQQHHRRTADPFEASDCRGTTRPQKKMRQALLVLLAGLAVAAALAAPAAALGCSNEPCAGHKCAAGQASFFTRNARTGPPARPAARPAVAVFSAERARGVVVAAPPPLSRNNLPPNVAATTQHQTNNRCATRSPRMRPA